MLLIEAAWATGMAIWVLMVIYGTRWTYDRWIANGMEPMVAVYYNRKIVHMLAAGYAPVNAACFHSTLVTSYWRICSR